MEKTRLTQLAENWVEEATSARRYLHSHPELSWHEQGTQQYIMQVLQRHGIECRGDFEATAVIGTIHGGRPGKTVALRADIDALPVVEESGCAYPSETPGVMHACGHDVHTSVLLGAALMLHEIRDELPGTVKLIFQPAEEAGATKSGAKTLVEKGVLDDVDAIFGTHVFPTVPLGQAGICEREMMAGVDIFKLKIHGTGGHLSTPHKTRSALYPALEFMNQISVLRTQAVDPFETAIIDTGYFHCGTAENIIPAEAEIIGNVRAYNDELRAEIKRRMEKIVRGLELGFEVTCDYEHHFGYDSLVNDPDMAKLYRTACEEVFGAENVITPQPAMGSEDFAFYLKKVKGAFSWLGVGDGGTGSNGLHSGSFFASEQALLPGMQMMANVALCFLNSEA